MGWNRGTNFCGGLFSPGGGFFSSGGAIIMGLIFLVLIIAIVYFIVDRNNSKNGSSGKSGHSQDQLMEELKRKYVSGEITEEEYLRKKDILSRD